MKYLASLWAGVRAAAIAAALFGLAVAVLIVARVGPFGRGGMVGASGSELLMFFIGLTLIFAAGYRRELRRLSRRDERP